MEQEELVLLEDRESQSVLDGLPDTLGLSLLVAAGVTGSLGSVFLAGVGVMGVVEFIRLQLWKREHLAEFKTFLTNSLDVDASAKSELAESPWMAAEEVWAAWGGEKLKVEDPIYSTWAESGAFTILLLGGPLAFLILLLAVIPA